MEQNVPDVTAAQLGNTTAVRAAECVAVWETLAADVRVAVREAAAACVRVIVEEADVPPCVRVGDEVQDSSLAPAAASNNARTDPTESAMIDCPMVEEETHGGDTRQLAEARSTGQGHRCTDGGP